MGLKNKDGVDIKEVWNDGGIKSYVGMTFEGFPNCFMIYSPHGKLIPMKGGAVPFATRKKKCAHVFLQHQRPSRTDQPSSSLKPT